MTPFQPTLGAVETGKNVRHFVRENKGEFWTILKSVIPYLLLTFAIIIVLQSYTQKEMTLIMEEAQKEMASITDILNNTPSKEEAKIKAQEKLQEIGKNAQIKIESSLNIKIYEYAGYGVQIIISYLFAVIAISWHRLVIFGHERYKPMQIFKPQKHEIHFMLLVGLTSFILPMIFGFFVTSIMTLGSISIVLMIAGLIFYIYLNYKICFLFPSRAVNADISIKDSFQLTKGYFWKFIGASFFACILTILAIILVFIISNIILMPIIAGLQPNGLTDMLELSFLLQGATMFPMYIYFIPVLTVLIVTVLSNYYQHALQNKPPIEDAP